MVKRIVVLLSVLALAACDSGVRGSGNLIIESFTASDFDRIAISGIGQVIVTQDGTESVSVETDDNIMEHIRVEVQGSTLELGTQPNVSVSPTELSFEVRVDELVGIAVSGAAVFTCDSVEAAQLEIRNSGAGTIVIDNVEATTLTVDISGSGDVQLAGAVEEQIVDISGAGDYGGGDLLSDVTRISVSGAGNSRVWVLDRLDATVSGSGSVSYYGEPTTLETDISGSGNVSALDEN